MTITLYGLKNCDSCGNARRWLDGQGVPYRFHDLREDGLDGARLAAWLDKADWTELLNRRSTTWRELSEDDKACDSPEQAKALMLAHPTLVKRPVLETPEGITIGFSVARYTLIFSGAT